MKRMVSRVSGAESASRVRWSGSVSALFAGFRDGAIDNLQYSEHRYRGAEQGLFRIRLPASGSWTGSRRANSTIYNPRALVGLPHNIEFGVNFPIYHNSDFDPSTLGYIQPNIKWKFFTRRRQRAWRPVPASW